MKLPACVWSLSVLICMNKALKMNNPTVNIKGPQSMHSEFFQAIREIYR